MSIEPCRSRGEGVSEELAAKATEVLRRKLEGSGPFRVVEDGNVVVSCDVELYEAGSAVGRWVQPGRDPSLAQIAVTLWERPGDAVLVTARGKAAVRGGGLYTIGADRYILSVAVDEVVGQLLAWTRAAEAP